MNIALFGYGKMGKEIEKIALSRNHTISFRIGRNSSDDQKNITKDKVDVIIEFTQPDAAYENIVFGLDRGIPVVSGTTGWLDKLDKVKELVAKQNGAFFYASNYSVGVNLFFQFNKLIAKVMNNFPDYNVEMEEIHHIHKKDAPSGTAITAAEGLLANLERKKNWVLNQAHSPEQLRIVDKRIAAVPGTHSVIYHSSIDSIELKHTAYSREGFATGAVLAAEFIHGKQGVFGMEDLLKF
jgi:4-hydroxy-tetrahydrodipicolinate reductase